MKHYFFILKNAFKRLRVNFGTMLLFIILFTIIGRIIAAVITKLMSGLALSVSGFYYVGNDNFLKYLASPVTIICIIVALLVVGCIQMVGIAGLITVFDASGRNEKTGLRAVVGNGVAAAAKLLNIKNWSIILFLMLMLPFLSITSLTTLNYTVSIPGFINDYLLSKLWSSLGILALNIVLFIFAVKWILSLHVFVNEPDTSFKEARKKSTELIRGKFFSTVFKTLVTGLLWVAIVFAVAILVSAIFSPSEGNVSNVENTDISKTIITITLGLVYVLLTPCINLAYLSAIYADLKNKKEGTEKEASPSEKHPAKLRIPSVLPALADKLTKKVKGIAWLIVVVFVVLYAVLYVPDLIGAGGAVLFPPEIAAHRGASKDAPENTMPAFKLAVDQGVSEWIEFDVHQSKDGEVIISHDDHIVKPPTDITVHKSTLPELKAVDVGLWFSEAFRGTRLSTLQEFLDYCRTNDIRLNLEIKPTKYDTDLVEKTMDLVLNSGIEDRIIISSLSSECLEKVKEIDPDRTTLLNMIVAAGDVGAIPYADWYGIEETNITDELVANVHAHGGEVFAWTVNSEMSIQYLIDCGVDGVNTDSPEEIADAVKDADYCGSIAEILRMIIHSPNFLQTFIY